MGMQARKTNLQVMTEIASVMTLAEIQQHIKEKQ